MKETYVNMQDNHVYMQDNHFDMQVTNQKRKSDFYIGKITNASI